MSIPIIMPHKTGKNTWGLMVHYFRGAEEGYIAELISWGKKANGESISEPHTLQLFYAYEMCMEAIDKLVILHQLPADLVEQLFENDIRLYAMKKLEDKQKEI